MLNILMYVALIAVLAFVVFMGLRMFIHSFKRPTKKGKQVYLINGYEFTSYYVAKAYAKDNNIDPMNIVVGKERK